MKLSLIYVSLTLGVTHHLRYTYWDNIGSNSMSSLFSLVNFNFIIDIVWVDTALSLALVMVDYTSLKLLLQQIFNCIV